MRVLELIIIKTVVFRVLEIRVTLGERLYGDLTFYDDTLFSLLLSHMLLVFNYQLV